MDTFTSYRAQHRLDMGSRWREIGQLCPEAVLLFRMEAYLHSGWIVEAQLSEAELRDAIAQYCPEQEAAVLARYDLQPAEPAPPEPDPPPKPPARKAPAKKAAPPAKR
jgi:hypothetical protein